MSSQFSLEYLQHLSQTQSQSSQNKNLFRKKLVCPKCKATKFRKNPQGQLVCIHGHELPHYRTEVSEDFDPTFSHVVQRKKKGRKIKETKQSVIDELGENRKILLFEAFQFILKKQIEILQLEMNFPAELSDIVRDLWIMYVTATKTYYTRKEVKKENLDNHTEEDEEINRILREAGVSESESNSDSDSDTNSDSDSDSSELDSGVESNTENEINENLNSNSDTSSESESELESGHDSDETILEEGENNSGEYQSKKKEKSEGKHKHKQKHKHKHKHKHEHEHKTKDKDKNNNKNKKKNKQKKKKKWKNNEEMLEAIQKVIDMPTDKIPLMRLSIIFIYLGCLWLRLPVMMSDLHTWINNEDIPYFSAIYCIPYTIKNLLTKKEINILIPKQIPECEWFCRRTAVMILFYEKNFKFTFPPINYPAITCRILSLLALPAEAYICVSRLVQLIQLEFNYKSMFSLPEVDLMAVILIIIKFIYGLDDEPRFSDEFCKNFYPLNSWLDCLLQRRKEYDSHGLPLYENDYISFVNNNVDKFIEYCQKVFVYRHDSKDVVMKNYKIFKDIVKFIKNEELKEKRHHHHHNEENEKLKIAKLISSNNLGSETGPIDVDSDIFEGDRRPNAIDHHISGFKALPRNKRIKIKSRYDEKNNEHDNDNNKNENKNNNNNDNNNDNENNNENNNIKDNNNNNDNNNGNNDIRPASVSALISSPTVIASKNSSNSNSRINDTNRNSNPSNTLTAFDNNNNNKKRKYPGEHYINYRCTDKGGEYHTPYTIVYQYCQDVILRRKDDSLSNHIDTIERKLLTHEEWLSEYFSQEKFQDLGVRQEKLKKGKEGGDSSDDEEDDSEKEEEDSEEIGKMKNNRNKKKVTFFEEFDNSDDDGDIFDNEYDDEEEYRKDLIDTLIHYEEKDETEYPFN